MTAKEIETAYRQSELDYLDAIEALQKECGMASRDAESLVEQWEDTPL